MPDEKPLPPVDFDFGPATAGPATEDDGLDTLGADLETQLAADTVSRRKREQRSQDALRQGRGPAIEVVPIDTSGLATSLRRPVFDFADPTAPTVTVRTARSLRRGPSRLARFVAPVARRIAPLFSYGPDPDNTARVLRGLAARVAAGALSVVMASLVLGGSAGSAYGEAYAADAGLRHTGGLAPLLVASGTGIDAQGMISDGTAAGVVLAVRAFLDAYHAAAASGDTTVLAALFADPAAAAPWVASATRLHDAGAVRTYPYLDPRTVTGVFQPEGDGVIIWSSGGPLYLLDEAPDGTELRRVVAATLECYFIRSGGSWQLREAVIRD
jgi:hypothetical protein